MQTSEVYTRLGFGASIIVFIIYYWYLRKLHVREYLGVVDKLVGLGEGGEKS